MAKCSICSHPKAAEIDAAIGPDGPSATARAFGVSKTSLMRHRDNCLARSAPTTAPTVAAAQPAAPADPPPVAADRGDTERAPSFSGRTGPGRPCETCRSPVRDTIEARLLAGDPWAAVAREVPGAPSHDSIRNHANRCIPDRIRAAHAATERETGSRLAGHVELLVSEAMALVSDARELVEAAKRRGEGAVECDECGNLPGDAAQLQAIRAAGDVAGKAAAVLTLAGKFSGELDKGRADIRDAKQWPAFTRAIAHAVDGCDACSEAVAKALEAVEEGEP